MDNGKDYAAWPRADNVRAMRSEGEAAVTETQREAGTKERMCLMQEPLCEGAANGVRGLPRLRCETYYVFLRALLLHEELL